MATGKTVSANRKNKYKNYRAMGTRLANKKARLARHLRNQPNDLQSASVLKKL